MRGSWLVGGDFLFAVFVLLAVAFVLPSTAAAGGARYYLVNGEVRADAAAEEAVPPAAAVVETAPAVAAPVYALVCDGTTCRRVAVIPNTAVPQTMPAPAGGFVTTTATSSTTFTASGAAAGEVGLRRTPVRTLFRGLFGGRLFGRVFGGGCNCGGQ